MKHPSSLHRHPWARAPSTPALGSPHPSHLMPPYPPTTAELKINIRFLRIPARVLGSPGSQAVEERAPPVQCPRPHSTWPSPTCGVVMITAPSMCAAARYCATERCSSDVPGGVSTMR